MSQREISICEWCKHYKGKSEKTRLHSCHAFPEGIPQEIRPIKAGLSATHDHRYPHDHDHGIQFEIEDDIEKLKDRLEIKYALAYFQGDESKVYQKLDNIFKGYDQFRKLGYMTPEIKIDE